MANPPEAVSNPHELGALPNRVPGAVPNGEEGRPHGA